MIESKIKYYQKHHNRIELTMFKMIYFCGSTFRLIGWSAAALTKAYDKKYCKENIILNLKSLELISKKLLEI